MNETIKPDAGQIWRDNDRRLKSHVIMIDSTDEHYAYGRGAHSIDLLKAGGGRKTRIAIARFRQNRKTGYTFVEKALMINKDLVAAARSADEPSHKFGP